MFDLEKLQDYSDAWQNGEDCRFRKYQYGEYRKDYEDPITFLELKPDERRLLLSWINCALEPRKSVCTCHTSYELRRFYQHAAKERVTNGQFKGAMIVAGYPPDDATVINPCYRISKTVKKEELPNA